MLQQPKREKGLLFRQNFEASTVAYAAFILLLFPHKQIYEDNNGCRYFFFFWLQVPAFVVRSLFVKP
jgi:hypothetical protein